MSALTKSEVEHMKAFLTRRIEKIRKMRRDDEFVYKRQCVFISTVNPEQYLRDDTGNRRFWAVKCGKFDIDGLTVMRDQLWAEAVMMYSRGDPWWFDEDSALGAVARIEQTARMVETDFTELLQELFEGRKFPFNDERGFVTQADFRTVSENTRIRMGSKSSITRKMLELGCTKGFARANLSINAKQPGYAVWEVTEEFRQMNPSQQWLHCEKFTNDKKLQ
jgi:predicted P-loop ATPase